MSSDRDHEITVESLSISREIRDRFIALKIEAEIDPAHRAYLPSGPSFTLVAIDGFLSQLDAVISGLEKMRKQMEDTLRLEGRL